MKSSRLLCLIILISLLVQPAFCQKITIGGSGKGYSNAELKVFRLSDPVTKSLVPVSVLDCDTSGCFHFSLDVRPEQTILIKTGIYCLYLYIDSVHDFTLRLPDYEARNEEDRQNTFFEETKSVPEVVNDRTNINNLIRTFDVEYDPLFNRIADRIMYNTRKNDIPGLIEKLNSFSSGNSNPYFSEFVRFRLVMLNQVAHGDYRGRVEDSVIINSVFRPENRAYTDLAEQMFTRYFRALAGGRLKVQFKDAVTNASVGGLESVIIHDGKASNEQLVEYIIILNLFSEYFESFIRHDQVLSILGNLEKDGSSTYIKELAAGVRQKLTALGDGSAPPDLNLKDDTGTLFRVSGLKGKYVLLSFGKSDNSFTLSEYGILKSWLPHFANDLKVVTVLRDRDFATGLKRLHNMGFAWTILDGSSADLEEYLFGVTMYPSFLLLDREGKILVRQCPFPSENFDQFFSSRLNDEAKKSAPEN